MKKILKYKLPQGMEVTNTNLRFVNGQVFLDIELKEKYKPQQGDCVILGWERHYGSFYWISIIKEARIDDTGIFIQDYVGFVIKAEGSEKQFLNKFHFNEKTSSAEYIRKATEKEKADFLARLEKECGKRWNEETKQLEDIRWMPKEKEEYFYVRVYDDILNKLYDCNNTYDLSRVKIGNCFKTKQAAQKAAAQIKEIFKNSKAE